MQESPPIAGNAIHMQTPKYIAAPSLLVVVEKRGIHGNNKETEKTSHMPNIDQTHKNTETKATSNQPPFWFCSAIRALNSARDYGKSK